MAARDIVVVGASAGGVEALRQLVARLPEKLPAALFVVLHMHSQGPGLLPGILQKAGKLPAKFAQNDSPVEHGRIYVAPVDQHLLLHDGRIRVFRGPKENRHRPAIDPLFRSAAWTYGPRVIGVVLSGMLDDGTAGLWAIKSLGGTTIVQDPTEALFTEMPLNASRHVEIDYSLRIEEIAALLPKLTREEVSEISVSPRREKLRFETEMVMMERNIEDMEKVGTPSAFTCPSCHGALWELQDGELVRFRCHVGHAFSAESLLSEQSETIETALYSALRAMEEKAATLRRLAHRVGVVVPAEKSLYESKADEHEQHATVIRGLLEERNP